MNTLRRGAVKKRFAMMHSSRSSCWSRLKLLYLVPAFAACLWVSAKAEGYETYLNGKYAMQEELESIDHSTIEHVDVLHGQKEVQAKTTTEREHDYYIIAEQMPQFPGGDAAMMQHISRHIRYPRIAIESGVEGTVRVEFIVETDGTITNVKASDPSSAFGGSNIIVTAYRQESSNTSISVKAEGIRDLKEYAEEIVRGMPPFEPGRQSGSAVRTKVTLPITFKLN